MNIRSRRAPVQTILSGESKKKLGGGGGPPPQVVTAKYPILKTVVIKKHGV